MITLPPPQPSTLDAALSYAARGWHVYPVHTATGGRCSCSKRSECPKPGKHPRTKNGVNDASADPEEIRRWFTTNPTANVGIATGAESGLFVLDVDGPAGETSLSALEREHGPLPATLTAHTGGGGRHLYFRHPGNGTKITSTVAFQPGLDIRADGTGAVAPPSVHVRGVVYQWENPSGEPAEVPAWLLALPFKKKRPAPPAAGDNGTGTIAAGARNATLASIAGTMRRRAISEPAILAALREENARQCAPPLDDAEVAAIAASVARYEPAAAGRAHLSDFGNARRLVAQHGTDLRFCWSWKKWLAWDGMRWALDGEGEVYRRAKAVIQSIYAEAAACPDETERKALGEHARRSETRRAVADMIDLARSEDGISVKPEDLDLDRFVLNVLNGTLNLKTGELREHRREDLITKLAPVEYHANAKAPMWECFVQRIMGGIRNLIGYLQQVAGYALTGDVGEQVLFLLHGDGGNGKSTWVNAVRDVLGPDYAKEAAPELLLVKRFDSHPTERADLFGMRFASTIEVSDGRHLAESFVKQLTGGDAISARRMKEDFWTFTPTFKLFLVCNHRPEIAGTDHAIWRRIKLIPFNVTIPTEERDLRLREKLRAEREGILAWMVEGCRVWAEAGRLMHPPEVEAAIESYRAEQDTVGEFLAECCVTIPKISVRAADLYAAFAWWFEENVGGDPVPARRFTASLIARGHRHESPRRATGLWWTGIGLLSSADGDEK